jgi:hypothetical protein
VIHPLHARWSASSGKHWINWKKAGYRHSGHATNATPFTIKNDSRASVKS